MCYTLEILAYGLLKRIDGCISGDATTAWEGPLGTEGNAIWNEFSWEPANKFQYKIILPAGTIAERCRLKLVSANTKELFSLISVEYHVIPRRGI